METATATPSTSNKVPPGPRGFPLLGVLPGLWRDPLQCLLSAAREYGDVVRLPIGPKKVYLVSHPDLVRYVLQEHHQNYVKAPHYKSLRPIFGDGLITSDGEFWRRQRRLAQPAFQKKRRGFFSTVMTASTASMLERWRAAAGRGEPIDVTEEMIDLTKDILFKAMFGGDVSDHDDRLSRALYQVEESINPVATADPFQILNRLPTRRNRQLREALKTIDDFVYPLMARRRQEPRDDEDFLSMLLFARDEDTGEGMTDTQVRDEVVTILQAGHEPTSNALTWTFYLLSQSPAVAAALKAEVETVLGDRVPSLDDMGSLTRTMMVIHEALRLYPPGWVLARSPIEDDVIGGYRVPAGSVVVVSPYVTHRLASIWPNPEQFDPERFAPDQMKSRVPFSFFPFGGGPRLCAGAPFALVEMPLVVAMVVRAFRLELVPGQRADPRPLISLLPPHLMMRPRAVQ